MCVLLKMLNVLLLNLLFSQYAEMVYFNNPGTRFLNENDDATKTLWSISATCYPSTDQYINVLGVEVQIGVITHTVGCETCKISINPDTGLFYMSGNTVYKRACSAVSCGSCPSCTSCSASSGCMSGPAYYNIDVRCYTTSYDNDDSGKSTLTVSVSEETPTLTINLPGAVNADNSMSVGTILATASKSSGPPIVEFTQSTAVDDSYLLGTKNMFDLNTDNGQVYVRTDPSEEYDFTYTIGVCIHSRRQTSCSTMTINFSNIDKKEGAQFPTVELVSGLASALIVIVGIFSVYIFRLRIRNASSKGRKGENEDGSNNQGNNRNGDIEPGDHYEDLQTYSRPAAIYDDTIFHETEVDIDAKLESESNGSHVGTTEDTEADRRSSDNQARQQSIESDENDLSTDYIHPI